MLDVNTNVNVEVSTQLAEAMWKSCAENGVGGLFKPWQMRRVAKAEADRLRILAQGQRDAELILKGEMTLPESRSGGALSRRPLERREDPALDLSALPVVVADHYIEETLRKEGNVAKTLLRAEEELQNDNSPAPEKSVDGDWLRRWRDEVGEVSSDDLQGIWARLLAGEVKSPGLHSLRTLDILRNLSADDARMIEKLAPLVIQDFIWREHGQDYLPQVGLDFDDLLYLEEIGVVSSAAGMISKTWENVDGSDSYLTLIFVKDTGLILTHPEKSTTARLTGVVLTRAGKALIKLCEFQANREYLVNLGNHLKTQGFTVELADLNHLSNGTAQLLTRLML